MPVPAGLPHFDLDFLRTPAVEESVPFIGHVDVPRGDILINPERDVLWMHPMMKLELRHHRDPARWLDEILATITRDASHTAAHLIGLLDVAGAEDRAMLDFQAWLDAERKAIAEIWFREVWGDPENFEAEGLAALLQALRDQRPEPPDTLEP